MALRRSTQETLYCLIVGLLVLLLLFSNFRLVGGNYVSEYDPKYCNGKGRINSTAPDGMCSCFGDYYGAQCTLRYCPRGTSWVPNPTGSHDGNRKYVECSNMGICDPYSGTCACRDGYEGRACERLTCPSPSVQTTGFKTLKEYMKTVYSSGIGVFARADGQVIPETYTDLKLYERRPCSGHGMCMTMREASTTFNGRNLVLPSVDYNEWDADKIQGCVCDDGWTGVDCSERQCLFGIDPLSTEDSDVEEYTLQCQATTGYFSLFILGMYTEPIPYDADPGYLKYAIERIPGVISGSVLISMPKNNAGLPTVCASSIVSTSIKFTDRNGPRPPIKVYEPTSDTRMWPNGGSSLLLSGSTPVLRMKTTYTLYCPACTSCSGYVSFAYGDSITDAYDVTTSSLFSTIESGIESLDDLSNSKWSNLDVSVSGSTYICDSTAKTTTIELTSDYGNIPDLKVIYKVYANSGAIAKTLTWSSTTGAGTLYECSNQGLCNRQNGVCQCVQDAYDNTLYYRVSSSDGANGQGTRADCGYIETYPISCYVGGQGICNGNGYCSNSTNLCTCYDGYHGLTCAVKECPKGYAWFDEATSSVDAHALTECSNMGTCDRSTGTCECRDGFTGAACEVHDCPRDSDGSPCSGHGWCMSSEHIAYSKGFSYGPSPGHHTNRRAYPAEWDARQLYSCVCSTQMGSNYGGHPKYPTIGPSGYISGIAAGGNPLPGWTGYDCSLRRCPSGDNVNYRNYYGGVLEVQRVRCRESASSSIYFKLRINGHLSDYIYGNDDLDNIESAIEWAKTVGNVTVSFPNSGTDSIVTACSGSHTGFLIQFDTELGDIPLVSVEYGSLSSLDVTVTETTKGTKSNLECGGPEMGFCNRDTGLCMCHTRQESSDGDNNAGSRGDCGYYNKHRVINSTRTITTVTGETITTSAYKKYP